MSARTQAHAGAVSRRRACGKVRLLLALVARLGGWIESAATKMPALAVAILAGCAVGTVSYAPAEHCTAAVPDGMARMVATRTASGGGRLTPIAVYDAGQPIGLLGTGRLCWLRHAGTALVTGYFTPGQVPMKVYDIDVPVAAGETVLLEVSTGGPWKRLRAER